MDIILAIKNEKIFNELKKEKEINIIGNNIQYKEGILEILEKNKIKLKNKINKKIINKIKLNKIKFKINKKIINKLKNKKINKNNYIIIDENINGEISFNKLINKINKKNKLLLILKNKNKEKEQILINKNIDYIYEKNLTKNLILKKIKKNEKIYGVIGAPGTGKTIITLLLAEMLSKENKVLIIEDNIENQTITNLYKIKKLKKYFDINSNLQILNIKQFVQNRRKKSNEIIKEIENIKNKYNYIFIDTQNFYSYKIYEKIINKNILIINLNLIEINKIKKIIKLINNKNKIKIIINNYNKNSISEKIIKNIFNNVEIIEKIKNNENYNLIINNNMNIKLLNNENKKILKKIIENL